MTYQLGGIMEKSENDKHAGLPSHLYWHGEDYVPKELIVFIEQNLRRNWRADQSNWDDVMLGAALSFMFLNSKK